MTHDLHNSNNQFNNVASAHLCLLLNEFHFCLFTAHKIYACNTELKEEVTWRAATPQKFHQKLPFIGKLMQTTKGLILKILRQYGIIWYVEAI